MAKKAKSGGWKTHNRAVRKLADFFGAPLKKTGRQGIYEVEAPADHPIARKLPKRSR